MPREKAAKEQIVVLNGFLVSVTVALRRRPGREWDADGDTGDKPW